MLIVSQYTQVHLARFSCNLLQIFPSKQYSMQEREVFLFIFLKASITKFPYTRFMIMEHNTRLSLIICISQPKVDFQEPRCMIPKMNENLWIIFNCIYSRATKNHSSWWSWSKSYTSFIETVNYILTTHKLSD